MRLIERHDVILLGGLALDEAARALARVDERVVAQPRRTLLGPLPTEEARLDDASVAANTDRGGGNAVGIDPALEQVIGALQSRGIDCSELVVKTGYPGVNEIVISDGETRTVFGRYVELLNDTPNEWLQRRIEMIDTPGATLSGWRLLMMMIEHEVHHRSQIDAYAGLQGWPVPDIFNRSAESISALETEQRAKYGR